MTEEQVTEISGWSGHRRLSIDEIAALQPGLGTIMPQVSRRYWILYYAAKAGHWPLANFQLKEMRELMEFGAFTRPKYVEQLDEFIDQKLSVIQACIERQDWPAFDEAYRDAIAASNMYHELNDKPFIQWKLPDHPPPDFDLTPKPPTSS